MVAKRPPIGWILLAGAASAAGAALATYAVRRRKRTDEEGSPAKNAEKDAEPGIPTVACGRCGAEVKEYEFFCPACGEPLDRVV